MSRVSSSGGGGEAAFALVTALSICLRTLPSMALISASVASSRLVSQVFTKASGSRVERMPETCERATGECVLRDLPSAHGFARGWCY